MIKKLLTYSFGEVIVKGISFLALPFYSYLILPEEYGVLGFLSSLTSFLPFVFTLYYLYAYVRFSVDVEEEELLSTYFYMGLFLNVFYFFCALVLYYLLIKSYDVQLKYYILSIGSSTSVYLFQILQMHHRSKGKSKQYFKFSVLYALGILALNFLFLFYFKDNVLAMLFSSLSISIIASLVAYRILKEYVKWEFYNSKLVVDVLRYSIPLVPGAIGLLLFSQSDKLILVNYVNKGELGIYVMATTIGLAMGYLGRAFHMAYQPIFYIKISEKKYDEIQEQFWKNIILIMLASLGSLFVVYVAYQFIDSKYVEGMHLSFIIVLAYTFVTFSQMMELHLTYVKRNALVSYIYIFGGVLTLVLLWLFVPIYRTEGAVIILFFTAMLTSILMYIASQKILYIPYNKLVLLMFYFFLFSLMYLFIEYSKGI
jgi:O-antigen/teichoic acid export membrane protein